MYCGLHYLVSVRASGIDYGGFSLVMPLGYCNASRVFQLKSRVNSIVVSVWEHIFMSIPNSLVSTFDLRSSVIWS